MNRTNFFNSKNCCKNKCNNDCGNASNQPGGCFKDNHLSNNCCDKKADCFCCPKCPPGPPGPIGPRGIIGPQGPVGGTRPVSAHVVITQIG